MNIKHHDSRFEIKDTTPTGQFSGYGSVYNVADDGCDVVAAGCFTDSLAEWHTKGSLPALLWQHNSREPVGSYTRMSEDANGLQVEGQLMMKTQQGQYAYECLRTKAVTGLSIGFLTREDSYDQKTGVRTIKKADLWEVSIVTFPMNDAARIDRVKSIPKFESPSQLEHYLRDACGVTKHDARAIVSEALTMFRRDAGGKDISQSILAALNRRSTLLGKKAMGDEADMTPEVDDNCSLAAGCCMPGECCNEMGKCMAMAIGAPGPMP